MDKTAVSLKLGDVVVTRKPHACGGDRWQVARTGADVKLTCLRCGHTVLLAREKAIAAVKRTEEAENAK